MKRAVVALLLGFLFIAVTVALAPVAHASLKDFLFGDKDDAKPAKPPKTLEELRSLQPIPFAAQDDDKMHALLHNRHVFGQYYAAVDVQMGANNYFPSDCDRNAGWKFLRFLGVNRDGTFSAIAKFTSGDVSTEFVPLFLVSKSGNQCEVKVNSEFGGKGVQVTPFFRLDASKEIRVQFEVRYSDQLTINVAKQWFDVFYSAAAGNFMLGGINIDTAGITLKQPAVLSGEEYTQIKNSVSGIDAQLTNIFGRVLDSDRKLSMSFTMPVEEWRGAWLRTGLGPTVDNVVGLKAANIALVIRPRISLLVDNKSVKTVSIAGAEHLVPDFSSLGSSPRTNKIFYYTKTKTIESFDSLSDKDEALKEKLKNLPKGADVNAWRSECGNVYRYLQSQYGLNDYDTLAIVAALFRSNIELDKANAFAAVGCSPDTLISDYWPPTNSQEVRPAVEPTSCWNDMAKRAVIREWLDETVLLGLRRSFKSDGAEKRSELLNKYLTSGASLEDPHGVLPAQSSATSIVERLRTMPLGDGGFCFDSPQGLDASLYQRGFLMRSGSDTVEALFEFEDLCSKPVSQQTPQINRVTLLGLSDDDDDLTLKTVERLLNVNNSCKSCITKLKSSLPKSFNRFQIGPACP